MKIAVLGASGRTGMQVLDRAADRGHEVVAVVRNPAKLASLTSRASAVGQADARDADAQAAAFRLLGGVDAVVFALGHDTGKPVDNRVMREGVAATLAAMRAADVHRLVVVSASGISKDGDGFFMRTFAKPIVQAILKDGFADMTAMEGVVRDSETDWTIVRPPQLTDKPARGRYRYRITLNTPGARITRADLADAILDALDGAGKPDALSEAEAERVVVTVAN
jgi:putative NADH-flavin reductase